MKYQNPIIKGFHPDPSICFDGEYFYLVTSTFEFFPGVPLYRSKNLVNWELIGHCLTDEVQCNMKGVPSSGGIYAPTIRFYQGTYYMVTTNVNNGGHFLVYTRDPHGKWSAPVRIHQDGIDPSLLFDGDKVYFVSNTFQNGKQGIGVCEINPETGEKYTETVLVSYGNGGRCPEAPHLYKIGAYYYMMLAEGGTEYGHMVTIFRSISPYGPYESCPHNPILSHRDAQFSEIQCTGHADLVEDGNGNWWMVCLGVRPVKAMLHNLGRETFLSPVIWSGGWPVVGYYGEISSCMEGDLPGEAREVSFDFHEKFCLDVLSPHWTYIRNPVKENYQMVHPGICLKGKGVRLDQEKESPTFLGIRQTEFRTKTAVKMKISSEKGIAGIVAYYNSNYYYAMTVIRDNRQLYLQMEKHIHDECIKSRPVEVPENVEETRLIVETDREFYYFYADIQGRKQLIGKGHVAGLCTEGTMTMTFTGVFLGLFALEGESVFQEFDYREIN